MRRTTPQILEEILTICLLPMIKTHIVYGVILNFKTVMPYLRFLMKNGYLEQRPCSDRYITSGDGILFLAKLHEVNEICDELVNPKPEQTSETEFQAIDGRMWERE